MHEENSFLTLTYDDAHLPADLSLCHEHFVLFFKRLRERLRPALIRFYMCGEYGDRSSRPHYHALLFGFYPKDRKYWRESGSGEKVFTSKFLDEVWSYGQVFVGDVTFESAAYVARYVMKKVRSDGEFREIFDPESGEIFFREHEYCQMSRRPGIGATWFAKYHADVLPLDRVVVRGHETRVPKYYDKLVEKSNPLHLAEIKARRSDEARRLFVRDPSQAVDRFERSSVHEVVKKASIKSLKRS